MFTFPGDWVGILPVLAQFKAPQGGVARRGSLMKNSVLVGVFAGLALTACATAPVEEGQLVADPYEGFNRSMFAFNREADRYVIGPAATAYKTVTPGFFREGVGNFGSNLGEPVNFVNNVLQGDGGDAIDNFYRFAINSTIGVLGVFDVASAFGLEEQKEDFGQTLAVWGAESGPYLVLPILGPTTPRDLFGTGIDRGFDPLNHVRWQADYLGNDEDFDTAFRVTTAVLGALNARVSLEEQFEQLFSQPEPYIALRRAYIGQRNAAIRDGAPEEDPYADLPDFDDFEDFE